MTQPWTLSPDRCFAPDPARRTIARHLYATVEDLPIVSPHGHVAPALLADPNASFGSPADLFIIPDHYVTRMLYSQGLPLEALGVPTRDGEPVETDHCAIWQRFADRFHLFRGTPTGLWLTDELINVFGVTEKLTSASAQRIYDHLAERLAQPEYTPRALFERFNITVLCTTDAATDPLRALEARRAFFKHMGATATDHAALTPYTTRLGPHEIEMIFARAMHGQATNDDAERFMGHMLLEMARMSAEDGLVMQLHVGSLRNHHEALFARFGPDIGADIPIPTEWTRNLRPLLNAYGADPRFRLILFTLDESGYGRELAPLAGHYPALLLGPPWWFFDSVNGMRRYLDRVVETAGLANTAGFNDDTRAFASIPTRHDIWRRVSCDWLAGMVAEGLIDEEDASEMALDCATRLAQRAYKLA